MTRRITVPLESCTKIFSAWFSYFVQLCALSLKLVMRMTSFKWAKGEEYFKVAGETLGLRRRALQGAGITVVTQMSVHGIQLMGTIVLARLLSPDSFGLIAMVTAFGLMFQNFGMRGFTEATIQSETIDHKKISTLFWIHLGISLGLACVFVVLAPFLVWFYGEPRLNWISIVFSISFVFSALSTQHLALLRRNMQFYKVSACEIIATMTSVLVAVYLAFHGWGYWSLVARRVSLPLAAATCGWLLCRWIPGRPYGNVGIDNMIKFGMSTYTNFCLNYVSRNLDKVLMGWRYGSQGLGIYEKAYYLFVLPVNQLSYPLTGVAVSTLSKLRNDPEKYRRYYLKAISMLAFMGMPVSAMLTLTGREFVILLLGPQWSRAGEVFAVFGPGIGVLLVYGTHGWLHLSQGKAERWVRWGILELIITGVSFLIGLPFGAIGVAVAYCISFHILIMPGLWYAGKPMGLDLRDVLSYTWRFYVAALIAGATCWYLDYMFFLTHRVIGELGTLSWMLMICSLCSVLYILLVLMLYRSTKPISQFVAMVLEMAPGQLISK